MDGIKVYQVFLVDTNHRRPSTLAKNYKPKDSKHKKFEDVLKNLSAEKSAKG